MGVESKMASILSDLLKFRMYGIATLYVDSSTRKPTGGYRVAAQSKMDSDSCFPSVSTLSNVSNFVDLLDRAVWKSCLSAFRHA